MTFSPGLSVRAAMASDRGRVRQENEDACLVAPERGLFVVSDGMGGHQAGAAASRIVTNVLPTLLERELGWDQLSSERVRRSLTRAVRELSGQLREEAKKRPDLAGMGATVALALLMGRHAHFAHLGDSRAYLFRRGRLQQLTADHTVTAALLHLGEIEEKDALGHPARHRLTRYVGMEGEALPDLRVVELRVGDCLLLCSDGLTGMVPDRHIAQVLRRQRTPEEACEALVAAANAAGGRDNVSVIVIDIDSTAPGTDR